MTDSSTTAPLGADRTEELHTDDLAPVVGGVEKRQRSAHDWGQPHDNRTFWQRFWDDLFED
ncbi:hypothetical protein GIS00_21020 [Nakamurella sp. YIM 132087]|uniref:Uncharacterized protein n=1 Tax=Nakamurella alba TaxID=2665158 RepID=A0A7K1FQJ3_9ACTN|nr:hypothetical protein [Nakamurella alba]MTD16422.1 hypothetical protein [Nakamurella alba]